jgi:excisionase family DNA binding protein
VNSLPKRTLSVSSTTPTGPPRLLLTPQEAATCLGLGLTKVRELVAAGTLPSIQIGACRRIPVAVLERFVAEGLAGPKAVTLDQIESVVADQ